MKHKRARAAARPQPDSRLALALLLLFSLILLAAAPARAATCLEEIVQAEKDYKIPRGLLLAVSLVETGGSGTPVAYALNVKGRAVMAKTELDAAKQLRDARGNVRGGVFAGCMQLSVSHHKKAFTPVERIVNPAENVRYAAKYLLRLRSETGSWGAAVARYNGGTGKTAMAYQCKVRSRLVGLGAGDSAALIDGKRCPNDDPANVSPKTRRTFQEAQVPVG